MNARLLLALLACAIANCADWQSDMQLKGMVDELARSKTLHLNDLDKPYFVEFSVSDSEQTSISASLGGVTSSNVVRLRQPRVQIRVGSYSFDNTNSVFSQSPRTGLLPLDDDYQAIRTTFWLSSDGLYKAAADEIARKRNALREISSPDQTPDFSHATPVVAVQPSVTFNFPRLQWEDRIRRWSGIFNAHPDVLGSEVRLLNVSSNYRLVNSEGTVIRTPQVATNLQIVASSLAPDGDHVWSHAFATALYATDLPNDQALGKQIEQVASEVDALRKAPLAEDYSGPVLFAPQAAAQMIAEVMTDTIRLQRKPLAPPSARVGANLESVWASRLNTKVGPDWLSIVDDPTAHESAGIKLVGTYDFDDQGVPGAKVSIVENGTFKNFLLSREPVRTFNTSNGHGRLPAQFGTEEPVIGNLFVRSSSAVTEEQIRKTFLQRIKDGGLKYGIEIRSLDFPSTANVEVLQDIARDMQKNGYARTISPPVMAFRIYPDGHEELVRGVRFREFSAKNLKDLALASDKPYVLNYVNNGSIFDYSGAGSDFTTSSVICPALLLDGVELGHAEGEASKPPIVPPPALVAQQ